MEMMKKKQKQVRRVGTGYLYCCYKLQCTPNIVKKKNAVKPKEEKECLLFTISIRRRLEEELIYRYQPH